MNDFTYDFDAQGAVSESAYAVPFRVDTLISGSTLLSKVEREEFQQKFGKDTCWLIGHIPKNPNELLISDYMLEKYGIPKQQQEYLFGETISLYFKDACILKDYTLCGIVNADVFYLNGKDYCAQIYVTEDSETFVFHIPSYKIRLFAEVSVQRTELMKAEYDLIPNDVIALFTAIFMQQVLIGRTSAAVCIVVLLSVKR